MSNSLGEAVLDLTADGDGLNRSIEGSKGKVLNTLNGLGTLGGQIFMAGLTAVIAGSALLAKGLYSSVQAAMEAEEVQAQLNAVLESTGGIAGVTADEVNTLADSLSQVTKFDDEAIVSAESLLLTFTKIGEDIFPQATETVLNMSEAFDQDLKSSAIQLGKALQDPIAGIGALSRSGVQFTEDQQKMIEEMVKAGDIAGAQAIIMGELETQVGGAARAAGETFAGQLAILQTKLGNIKETIGVALLPVLGELAAMFGEYLNRPETKQFIEDLAAGIGNLATQVATDLPVFIANIQAAFGWFETHQGAVIAALAAIGVALAAFVYTTVIPAAISVITALAPILLIMAAVAAVAYILYEAWTNNWGGIRDALIEFWVVVQPYLQMFLDFMSVQLALAIQNLSLLWTTVLLPALQRFFGWVATVVIPALITLVQWLALNVPKAIATLIDWWNGLKTAVTAAMTVFKQQVNATIARVVDQFRNFINQGESVVGWIRDSMTAAFMAVGTAIRWVVGLIQQIIKGLQQLAQMDLGILQQHSPSPLEQALMDAGAAMDALSGMALPDMSASINSNLGMNGSTKNVPLTTSAGFGGAGGGNQYIFNMQKSDLNEDQLTRALQRAEMLYA